jgi:hypothetical protein
MSFENLYEVESGSGELEHTVKGSVSPGEVDRITYLDSEEVRQYEHGLHNTWSLKIAFSKEGKTTWRSISPGYQRITQNGEIFYFYHNDQWDNLYLGADKIYCLPSE